MKKLFITFVISLLSFGAVANAEQASLTIANRSDYTITVKVMKAEGGLYATRNISAHSSSTLSFPSSGNFYTKTKASKGIETLYKKGGTFEMTCNRSGYTEATLEFYVTGGYGSSGQNISKSEFEKDY